MTNFSLKTEGGAFSACVLLIQLVLTGLPALLLQSYARG